MKSDWSRAQSISLAHSNQSAAAVHLANSSQLSWSECAPHKSRGLPWQPLTLHLGFPSSIRGVLLCSRCSRALHWAGCGASSVPLAGLAPEKVGWEQGLCVCNEAYCWERNGTLNKQWPSTSLIARPYFCWHLNRIQRLDVSSAFFKQ